MRRFALLGLMLTLLGACDRSYGRLPPQGIAGLDGTYRGQAALVLGRPGCPKEVPYAFTVRNGNVTGDIFSPRDPEVLLGRFQALIDSEGKIGIKARAGGDETLVEGFFDLERFHGSTRSENCTNRLTLRRVGP